MFWDQRSHGKSGRSSAKNATIDQLGRDLYAVIEATAPTGRVVLVGHSMGGMTIMALADRHPELFADRVVGVALIGTSTGKIAEVTFGLPAFFSGVTKRALPFVTRGMIGQPQLVERGRRIGTDLAFVATRRAAFGSSDVSPSLVEFVETMTAAMPVDVIAEFFETFVDHDKLAALPALRGIEVLILAGSEDKITPVGPQPHDGGRAPLRSARRRRGCRPHAAAGAGRNGDAPPAGAGQPRDEVRQTRSA